MDAAFAVVEASQRLGVVLAGAATAGVFMLRSPHRRAAAMATALALVSVILVSHIWDTEQLRSITDNPGRAVLAAVAGIGVVSGLAVAFVRRMELFALASVAALPFRVPIEAVGTTSNLLVPLYLVIAGGVVACVWRAARRSKESASGYRRPGRLEQALALFVVLYALQSLYSKDFDTALEQMVFFFVPFALLAKLLVEVPWSRRLVLGCAGILLVLALAFSGLGFWEYGQRELFWNPKVISANQFESYFRVNSVFWDPNIYGRFLVLVMVTASTAMLWAQRYRLTLGVMIVLAVLWGGLVLTFSQSSLVALLVGLAVLAAVRWNPRRALAVSVAGVAVGGVFLLAFQDTLRVDLGSSSGLNRATSGRADLIEGGVELFGDRPLWGYGSGSFARTFRIKRKGNQRQAVSASHTYPVTVAAEQGIVGLAAYVLVLVASFRLLLVQARTGAGRGPPRAEVRDDEGPDSDTFAVARVALAAAYAALVAHTMMYAAFLEDPFTWVILAIGLAVAPWSRLDRLHGASRRDRGERAAPAPASSVA